MKMFACYWTQEISLRIGQRDSAIVLIFLFSSFFSRRSEGLAHSITLDRKAARSRMLECAVWHHLTSYTCATVIVHSMGSWTTIVRAFPIEKATTNWLLKGEVDRCVSHLRSLLCLYIFQDVVAPTLAEFLSASTKKKKGTEEEKETE